MGRYVEVEVDIDDVLEGLSDRELREFGLHDAEACGKEPGSDTADPIAAVAELHRQAHSDQASAVDLCRKAPCRDLSVQDFPNLGGA